jgi:hypothetical protein
MSDSEGFSNLQIPTQVWVEVHADDQFARDVIVKMENSTIYNAVFVTLDYVKRQMDLTYAFSNQIDDTIPSRFCTLDVPHVVVESLDREAIEDTIDNLLAMEVFGSVFTQVTEDETPTKTPTTNGGGRRATQEVAAVVLSDVLVVE